MAAAVRARGRPARRGPGSTHAAVHDPGDTDEDREVVENLELLESLDAASDLEVLLELAEEK
ncbi:hypothetical protein [Corallococcus sicarius]|uniref:hypothetical protein n=1 Tax=Corallococcus sicarius TaxID=2316726 RepID=UPI0011C378AA|nr:hypothetical protein [Corallococcus sicarius]